MKKIVFFVLFLLVVLNSQATNNDKPDLEIYKTATPPVIDGEEDNIWQGIDWVNIDMNRGDQALKNNSGKFKMIYDDKFLYVLVNVEDAVIDTSQSINVWEKDCIELYLLLDTSSNSCTNAYGSFWGLRKVYGRAMTDYSFKGFIAGESHLSNSYTQEWRLSWDSLVSTMDKDFYFDKEYFKFTVVNSDNDGKGRNSQLFWHAITDNCMCIVSPDSMGLVKLSSTYVNLNNTNIGNIVDFYPNPASGRILINSISNINEIGVYTVNGHIIQRHKGGSKEILLDMGKINNGIYILLISTDTGITTEKLVIIK